MAGEMMRIGVFVCECGPNIANSLEIDEVIKAVEAECGVVTAERYKLLCSPAGKKWLAEKIKEHELTHLVIAACSPKQHEATFMGVAEEAGLNPHMIQMANIREQCAWVTENKTEATLKAKRMVNAALRRVRYHLALQKRQVAMNPDVLIIGGGVAGMTAAELVAGPSRKVILVEKAPELGGAVITYEHIFPTMASGKVLVETLENNLRAREEIEIITEAEVEELLGFFGNFEITIRKKGVEETLKRNIGAIIVATGYDTFVNGYKNANEYLARYGYGTSTNPDVVLLEEAEKQLAQEAGALVCRSGEAPNSVAIIHCVGREAVGYCSEVCCLAAMKFARQIKSKYPRATVTELYYDLCLPKTPYQQFYQKTAEQGVRFVWGKNARVADENGKPVITYTDAKGDEGRLGADMVILSTALTGSADAAMLAEKLSIDLDDHGFFLEEHEMLDAVATTTEGIYIIGCAHGPKPISEVMVQAEAAAGRILASLIPGQLLEPEVRTSCIAATYCMGCKKCLTVCCYGAITFDELNHVAVVNEIICRGCGNCVAACPSGAISLKHFTYTQLYNELLEAVR